MTAEEFIEKQSYVILNPEYPLVEKTDALIAVKMAREEERKRLARLLSKLLKPIVIFMSQHLKNN